MKYQCVEQHRNSGNQYNQPMIVQNTENVAGKCFRYKTDIAPYEDSYSCIYCGEIYSAAALGYCKFYELDEMEQLLMKME